MKIEITIEEIEFLQGYGVLPMHSIDHTKVLNEAGEEISRLRDEIARMKTTESNDPLESRLKRCQEQLTLASRRADEFERRLADTLQALHDEQNKNRTAVAS